MTSSCSQVSLKSVCVFGVFVRVSWLYMGLPWITLPWCFVGCFSCLVWKSKITSMRFWGRLEINLFFSRHQKIRVAMLLFLCSHVWNLQRHDYVHVIKKTLTFFVHPNCGFSRTCLGCDGFIEVEFMCLCPPSYNGICDVLHLQNNMSHFETMAQLKKKTMAGGIVFFMLASLHNCIYLLKTNISQKKMLVGRWFIWVFPKIMVPPNHPLL